MIMNKKITTLAAAVLAASSAQADFEMAYVAVDADGDTYVQNLGTYAAMQNNTGSGSLTFDVSAVNSSIDAYSWTVVGTNSTSNVIASPPGATGFTAYDDTGIITTSSGAPTGLNVANNQAVEAERAGLEAWLSTVASLAGGANSVVIPASSADRYTVGQQVAFHAGRMQTGTADFGTFQLNEIFHSANATGLAAPFINNQAFGLAHGEFCSYEGGVCLYNAAVPIPAAAWLFGSALLGIGAIKRKKN